MQANKKCDSDSTKNTSYNLKRDDLGKVIGILTGHRTTDYRRPLCRRYMETEERLQYVLTEIEVWQITDKHTVHLTRDNSGQKRLPV